jgi:hypothetical protein
VWCAVRRRSGAVDGPFFLIFAATSADFRGDIARCNRYNRQSLPIWDRGSLLRTSRRPAEDVIMARRLILAILLGLAPLSGCTTCDNPYDDDGPVIDANFHPAGFRSGSRGAPLATPIMAPETIPTPPPPPMEPSEGESDPGPEDQPPEMDDMETTSVMRPRLRYAR